MAQHQSRQFWTKKTLVVFIVVLFIQSFVYNFSQLKNYFHMENSLASTLEWGDYVDDGDTKADVKLQLEGMEERLKRADDTMLETLEDAHSKIAVLEGKIKGHLKDEDQKSMQIHAMERRVESLLTTMAEHGKATNTADTNTHTAAACPNTFRNSEQWLNSPRISNINEEGMTHELVQSTILHVSPLDSTDGSKNILNQSMCVDGSKLLSWEEDLESTIGVFEEGEGEGGSKLSPQEEEEIISYLTYRLMYIAVHEHQHGPARQEALARYNPDPVCKTSTTEELETNYNVGKFDYECPDTKFIVSVVSDIGFGASLRVGVMDPFLLGLASNRTVLFLNTISKDIIDLGSFNRPLKLASCERQDMQCVFMPLSPCVITEEEMSRAPILEGDALKNFRNTGVLGPEHVNERVLIVEPILGGHKALPFGLEDAMVDKIQSLYKETDGGKDLKRLFPPVWDLSDNVLEKVYNFIRKKGKQKWIFHHLINLYFTRPNLKSRSEIDSLVQKALPADFDAKSAIGLPIRGSDKCRRESECLTFDQYMEVVKEFGARRSAITKDESGSVHNKIILTTESKNILESRHGYTAKNGDFPYEFIVNEEDVGQGSGNPNAFTRGSYTADDVMISSMVSLKLQLHANSLLLNTCSNFHVLIGAMKDAGCGLASYAEVMKDNVNPEFRLKCGWDH